MLDAKADGQRWLDDLVRIRNLAATVDQIPPQDIARMGATALKHAQTLDKKEAEERRDCDGSVAGQSAYGGSWHDSDEYHGSDNGSGGSAGDENDEGDVCSRESSGASYVYGLDGNC